MSDADLERRLERLEDIEAIRRLKWRYGLAADQRSASRPNVASMVALFTEDAVWECNRYGRALGREAIRTLLAQAPAGIEWSLHFLQDTNIDIASDRRSARGRWYLLEAARMTNPKNGKAESVWISGIYDDEFVRTGERWLLSAMKLDIQKIVGETEVWD